MCVVRMWQMCAALTMLDLRGSKSEHAKELRGNRVTASGGKLLARSLEVNNTITVLDMRWNALGVTGAEALAAALRSNSTLTTVRVCGNALGDAGVSALADALVVNRSVQEWTASDNAIHCAGGVAVFRMLKTNVTLRTVNIQNRFLRGAEAGRALVDMLGTNRSLEQLDAGGMNVWGDVTPAVWKAVDAAIAIKAAVGRRFTFVDSSFFSCRV
jgi:hypothetical protein